ncbi:MAG: hypothetical protein WBA54_07975 [Acidaminobacteraceae bacterium]
MNTLAYDFKELSFSELHAVNGGGTLENIAASTAGVIMAVTQAGGAGYLGVAVAVAAAVASPVAAAALTVAGVAAAGAAIAYMAGH